MWNHLYIRPCTLFQGPSVLYLLSRITARFTFTFSMLRTTIILCLLAICNNLGVCEPDVHVQIIDARNDTYWMQDINRHLHYVRYMVSYIKYHLKTLFSEKTDYYTNTHVQLIGIRNNIREMVDEQLADAVNKARADVDARIAKGYDAEYCYRDVEKDVFRIRETTFYELARCVDSNVDRYSANIFFAKSLLMATKTAISMLNRVAVSCFFDLFNEHDCFRSTAKQVILYVEDLKVEYNTIKEYVPKTHQEVEYDTILCFKKIAEEAEKEIATTVFFTDSCVEGAE